MKHIAFGVMLLRLCWSILPSLAAADERPNFLLIFCDDIGFGDLASYGHPYAKTLNLDRLAAEGTSFRQFHVSGNVCPVTRAGLMSSRNPSWYPNYTEDFGFMGQKTITNILKDAGYYTGTHEKAHPSSFCWSVGAFCFIFLTFFKFCRSQGISVSGTLGQITEKMQLTTALTTFGERLRFVVIREERKDFVSMKPSDS